MHLEEHLQCTPTLSIGRRSKSFSSRFLDLTTDMAQQVIAIHLRACKYAIFAKDFLPSAIVLIANISHGPNH